MRFFEFNTLLNEINMYPGHLINSMTKSNALAGMEFELLVPAENYNIEPFEDFSFDEDIRHFYNIYDIMDFFQNGTDGSRNDNTINDFTENLFELYSEWLENIASRKWKGSEGFKFFSKHFPRYVKDSNIPPSDIKEFIKDAWQERGEEYEDIYMLYKEELENDADYDFHAYLIGNYKTIKDLPYEDYVVWPYQKTELKDMLDDLSYEFSKMIGKKVNYGTGYKTVDRLPNTYTIEPDPSISADFEYAGLEFISPTMSINEMFNDLEKVISWAKNKGCFTDSSTGLHMNVSIPNHNNENIDFIKLILLLGDSYILGQYDRMTNTTCKSMFRILQNEIKSFNDLDIINYYKIINNNLERLASKMLHDSITVDRYVSINIHDNRIEFRGPGNDWLNKKPHELKTTLARCVVVLNAASDPNAYNDEYRKKLYKFLSPHTSNKDILSHFVNFNIYGNKDTQSLKNMIKRKREINTSTNTKQSPLAQLSASTEKIKQQNISSVNTQPTNNDEITDTK